MNETCAICGQSENHAVHEEDTNETFWLMGRLFRPHEFEPQSDVD